MKLWKGLKSGKSFSDQKGPRAMGRHASTGSTSEYRGFTGREGARSHRKPIRVTDTSTTVAVVRNDQEVVIAAAFVKAVKAIYIGGGVVTTSGGSIERVVELVATQLQLHRRRRSMPRWDNHDVETALDYLATKGQIALPTELALAAS